MPKIYFQTTNKKQQKGHENLINKLFESNTTSKIFSIKGENDETYISHYDTNKIKNKILRIASECKNNILMYRIFPNKSQNFIVSIFSENLDFGNKNIKIPNIKELKKLFFNKFNRLVKHVDVQYDTDTGYNKTRIYIKCINAAHNTLISNIIETLERHKLTPDFIEILQIKKIDKKIKDYYDIKIEISSKISVQEYKSLKDDFSRYIQLYIKSMSIFDMIGPAMVGPSSSHTAGANRIGQIARNIILATIESGEEIKDIEVKLIGSFRDTGIGHKTPLAIGGGLCGFNTDDPKMLTQGDPDNLKKNGIRFGNQIAKFNGYKKGTAEDDLRYANQRQSNIAEIIFNTTKTKHIITGFSIGAGNVEIRVFDNWLSVPITGKIDLILNKGKIEKINDKNNKLPKIKKIYNENFSQNSKIMPFQTFEELIEYTQKKKIWIIDLIIEIECILQKTEKKEIYEKMLNYWNIMEKSVDDGIKNNKLSMMKLSGKDANHIEKYRHGKKTFDNIYGKAVTYSVAVSEINAKSGTIVACPTAGSCGILPGVLKAYKETQKVRKEKLLESLMIAGFFGMILFDDVTTAGADYGCQSEIGAAAGMAAAALVYLEGGDIEQMVEGFILAIKNCLGLVCDPVAGLVEIPCIKRNGIYSSHAISAALMALSGVKSFISPDEVVLTMREIGNRLNIDYKETSRGGLAQTRDGKGVEKNFEYEIKKFFG